MTLPDRVQIGPFLYDIVQDADNMNALSNAERCDLLGFCSSRDQSIHVRPGLGRDVAVETLLHEVLHAVMDIIGVQAEMGGDDEESLVRRLSPALLDLLRRNPGLVKVLTTHIDG